MEVIHLVSSFRYLEMYKVSFSKKGRDLEKLLLKRETFGKIGHFKPEKIKLRNTGS